MNISLPESMRDWVEKQANIGGDSTADAFVERVLRLEKKRVQDEIDQRLIEGLNSGEPVEMTEELWAERRRFLHERINAKVKEVAG